MNRLRSVTLPAIVVSFLFAPAVQAAFPVLTYRYEHHIFQINPNTELWQGLTEQWELNGQRIQPSAAWRVDGDEVPNLPAGVSRAQSLAWDETAIISSLQRRIAATLNREPGKVVIDRTASGSIIFDGVGLPGRTVDINQTVQLTIYALENGIADIVLPVEIVQPSITVKDLQLQQGGITEVVTVGESNFSGSPANRRHNIAVGFEKFNGHVIPKNSIFSFNEILGPVDASTGYKKELVILGERTLPDFGGGLCQVSTTAYRGIWEYGFPIEQRRNHSFAVAYYGPQGTDATIYPPSTDMKFTNDGASDLLLQTHVEGDNGYFIFYGTRDDRQSEIVGPFTWGYTSAPPERSEFTTDIAPGTKRKVGSAVPGMKAAWFRIVKQPNTDEKVEGYYSSYEARPLFYQIGVTEDQMPKAGSGSGIDGPGELVPEQPAA